MDRIFAVGIGFLLFSLFISVSWDSTSSCHERHYDGYGGYETYEECAESFEEDMRERDMAVRFTGTIGLICCLYYLYNKQKEPEV